jgi:hypothetical protein
VAIQSWLCLGGTPLTEACRSQVYAQNGFRPHGVEINACGCCGTPAQWAAAMDDAPYTNPTDDKAPWYSTSEPDSGDFGGFMVTSIDGLGAGPITRSLTQRANGRGSFLGPAVQSSPVITITGILFGKTCCSVDYGLRWLGNVLQGSCGADCDGDQLAFLDCCPDFDACATAAVTPYDCLTPHLRYLEGVQLVASPKINQRYGACCGDCNGTAYMEISFQLAATSPCVYRNPVHLATDQPFDAADPVACDITWVLVGPGGTCPDDTICAEPDDCLAGDPCADVPSPPTAPVPSNPCICTSFNTRRTVVEIPAGSIPEYTEGVPVVSVFSGPKDLRQLRVRFWLANAGQTVDELDPCTACGEVTLSRVPTGSTFTFDAKTRKATITCPDANDVDATPLMGSAGGRLPVEWPEIQCAGARYLVSVEADSDSVSPESTVSLDLYAADCTGSVA